MPFLNGSIKLKQPLEEILLEVVSLKASLSEVDKIELMLRNARGRVKDASRRTKALSATISERKEEIAKCEKLREARYKDFEMTIIELQERTDRKHLMLAKRLDGYEAEAETPMRL